MTQADPATHPAPAGRPVVSPGGFTLPPSFYEDLGSGRYRPTEAAIGPWAPDLLHGGPPIALLAHALRTHAAAGPMQIARLTVEILGAMPLAECALQVEVLRPGRRIELLRATMQAGGRTLLLAHAWRLEPLPGSTPVVAEPWTPPPLPGEQPYRAFPGVSYFPYGHAMEWRYVEGAFDALGPATLWTRPRIPLLDSGPTDPLEALLLMLDSANGVSAELDLRQWSFVPVDLTLNVDRHPHGTWTGMAARTVIADDGIGTVSTQVFDERGPLGRSLHTLFVRRR